MLNYSNIYDLCEVRKIKVKELCSYIGITYQGLKTGINTEKMSADKIEALCRCLKITPNQFFNWSEIDMPTENNTQYGIMNNQNIGNQGIEVLQQQLAKKDEQIDKLLSILNK